MRAAVFIGLMTLVIEAQAIEIHVGRGSAMLIKHIFRMLNHMLQPLLG
jgi:hypothetical protein